MKLLEQIDRINRLHEMIKYRRTGTPKELARRLNLSTSMIYKLMEELKLREAPIQYSRQLGTYYYSKSFQMKITIDFKMLPEEDKYRYMGGCSQDNVIEINLNFSRLRFFYTELV